MISLTNLPLAIRKLMAKITGATIQDGAGARGGQAFAIGKNSRAIGGASGDSYTTKKKN